MEWVQQGSLLRQKDMRLFKFYRMESQVFSGVTGGNVSGIDPPDFLLSSNGFVHSGRLIFKSRDR